MDQSGSLPRLVASDPGSETTVREVAVAVKSDSPCEPYCVPKPSDFDSVPDDAHEPTDNGWHTHHTVRHQHHQDYLLRRSLPGSLIRKQNGAGLLSSVGMSSNNQTSQQQ